MVFVRIRLLKMSILKWFQRWVSTLRAPSHRNRFQVNSNGSPVKLFVNAAGGVVDLHFQWMQTYGLDGVLIQRFVTEVNSPGTALDQRNKILQQMDAAASKHGRAYAMMWDMSGGSNQWDTNIKDDYNNYVKKHGPISNT